VEKLRRAGVPAVSGDATEPATLIQAHVAEAAALVIATPETVGVRKMIEIARMLNPRIETVVRSHNEDEAKLLEREGAGKVFLGESELAQAMAGHVVARIDEAHAAAGSRIAG
jgi:CPA2 family monovalent cation:H+ antiporter-2